MAQKVTAICAGEAHTLALTADGSVFSWGRGTFGRLGTGKEEDELQPVPVRFDQSEKVGVNSRGGRRNRPRLVAVAAGAYHSLALQDDGSVWSWGYNIYGQLGQGEENSLVPCLVERFLELGPPDPLAGGAGEPHAKRPLKVSSVKAGGMMSLAIDSVGGLWIWGNCPQQSSTDDDDEEEFSFAGSYDPLPVWDFHGHTVVKVACGNEHVVALVTPGETYTAGDLLCYAWGNNSHGQLGLGDYESRGRPRLLPAFGPESPWAVYEVACGAFHTALLTQRRFSEEDMGCRCWTFGLGENGQLGHGTSDNSPLPRAVDRLPPDAILISVDCGLFHTSVVSVAGEVWSWGMEKGLGLCPDARFQRDDGGDALAPLRIRRGEPDGAEFPGPVQVACGAAHTVLAAGDGYKLWAWGRGRSGVLGRGHLSDSFAPCPVRWPPGADDTTAAQDGRGVRTDDRGSHNVIEMDGRLSAAHEDVRKLHAKLATVHRYASVLHASVFGTVLEERHLLQSHTDAAPIDLRKELEQKIESADFDELGRLEAFYRNMLARVKDRRMRLRIQEVVRESLSSLSPRGQ